MITKVERAACVGSSNDYEFTLSFFDVVDCMEELLFSDFPSLRNDD